MFFFELHEAREGQLLHLSFSYVAPDVIYLDVIYLLFKTTHFGSYFKFASMQTR